MHSQDKMQLQTGVTAIRSHMHLRQYLHRHIHVPFLSLRQCQYMLHIRILCSHSYLLLHSSKQHRHFRHLRLLRNRTDLMLVTCTKQFIHVMHRFFQKLYEIFLLRLHMTLRVILNRKYSDQNWKHILQE